jgi:hypothetical protein
VKKNEPLWTINADNIVTQSFTMTLNHVVSSASNSERVEYQTCEPLKAHQNDNIVEKITACRKIWKFTWHMISCNRNPTKQREKWRILRQAPYFDLPGS